MLVRSFIRFSQVFIRELMLSLGTSCHVVEKISVNVWPDLRLSISGSSRMKLAPHFMFL